MFQTIALSPGRSGLVIVAHPDDETIWCGGLFIKFPKVRWTILVLSRASDPDRAPKFAKVAKYFNARGIIADLNDEGDLTETQAVNSAKKIIANYQPACAGRLPTTDYLFTHGATGEYGHYLHKAVHRAVVESISAKEIYCFNYKKVDQKKFGKLIPRADSTHLLKLTNEQYAKKRAVMSKIYGFAPNGIDTNYCTKIEGYKKI